MTNIKRDEAENQVREKLIGKIEGFTGTLESVPYNAISTDDLEKILVAFQHLTLP